MKSVSLEIFYIVTCACVGKSLVTSTSPFSCTVANELAPGLDFRWNATLVVLTKATLWDFEGERLNKQLGAARVVQKRHAKVNSVAGSIK
jgi:hypothetical protein